MEPPPPPPPVLLPPPQDNSESERKIQRQRNEDRPISRRVRINKRKGSARAKAHGLELFRERVVAAVLLAVTVMVVVLGLVAVGITAGEEKLQLNSGGPAHAKSTAPAKPAVTLMVADNVALPPRAIVIEVALSDPL